MIKKTMMAVLALFLATTALADDGDGDRLEFQVDMGVETRTGVGGLITTGERGSGPIGDGYLVLQGRMGGDLTLPQPYLSLPYLHVDGAYSDGTQRDGVRPEVVATYDRDMAFGRSQSGTLGGRIVAGNLRNRVAIGAHIGMEALTGEHSAQFQPIAVVRGEADREACKKLSADHELCAVVGAMGEVGTQFSVAGRGALQYRRHVNDGTTKGYIYAGPEVSGTINYAVDADLSRSVGAAGFNVGLKL